MLSLSTHDKQPFDLDAAVAAHPVTVLVVFRGPWCPGCKKWWKGFKKLARDFEADGIAVYGLSADKKKRLRRFRKDLKLPFPMISDPKLKAKKALDLEVSKYHPMSPTYPKGAFLQPAVFVWTADGKNHYAWRAEGKMDNLYGYSGRPRPKKILAKARRAAGVEEAPDAPAEAPAEPAPPARRKKSRAPATQPRVDP